MHTTASALIAANAVIQFLKNMGIERGDHIWNEMRDHLVRIWTTNANLGGYHIGEHGIRNVFADIWAPENAPPMVKITEIGSGIHLVKQTDDANAAISLALRQAA